MMHCFSAFVDINRGEWGNYQRSNKEYFDSFNLFYGTLQTNITVFTEEASLPHIVDSYEKYKQNNDFKSKVSFELFKREDLYYFQILDEIKAVQSSDTMKRYCQRDPSNPPEYSKPAYVATMLCKPIFLQLAKQRKLIPEKVTSIAWSDFGIAHGEHNQPYIDTLKNKKLLEPDTDKIIFFNRKNYFPPADPRAINSVPDRDDVFVPGGFYVVPVSLIEEYNNRFHKIVRDVYLNNSLIDDDQNIMSIFAALHKDISILVDSTRFKNNPPEGDFFPVFDFLKEVN